MDELDINSLNTSEVFVAERMMILYLMVGLIFFDGTLNFIIGSVLFLVFLGFVFSNLTYYLEYASENYYGRSRSFQGQVVEKILGLKRVVRLDWYLPERYAFWIERLVMVQLVVCTFIMYNTTNRMDHTMLLQLPSFMVFPATNLLYLLASYPNLLKQDDHEVQSKSQESKEEEDTDGNEETGSKTIISNEVEEKFEPNLNDAYTDESNSEVGMYKSESEISEEIGSETMISNEVEEKFEPNLNDVYTDKSNSEVGMYESESETSEESEPKASEESEPNTYVEEEEVEEVRRNIKEEKKKLSDELAAAYYNFYSPISEKCTKYEHLFMKSEEECKKLKKEMERLNIQVTAEKTRGDDYYNFYSLISENCTKYENLFKKSEEECKKLKEEIEQLNIQVTAAKTRGDDYYNLLINIINESMHVKCREETAQLVAERDLAYVWSENYRHLMHDLDL